MNITRHLYLTTAVRAPDEAPAPDETPAPEAVVAGADAPAANDPPVAPEAPETPPAPTPPTMVPLRILQQRVGEESTKRETERTQRIAAETKAANLQAIIDRMQGERRTPPDLAAPPAPAPRAPVEQPNIEEAVRREVDSREVTRSINDVIQKGVQEFTRAQWDEKAGILAALGAATPDFVQDVIAVDPTNAHRIIFTLAEDPAKAADLASMNVRQRTAELTRMSMAEQAKNPPVAKVEPVVPVAKTPVSKAPAPTTVPRANADVGEIDPTTPDGNEKMSDAQWEKWYKDKYYKRA